MQHSAQQWWLLTFFWGQNILIARTVRKLNYIEKNKAVNGVCSTDMNDEEQEALQEVVTGDEASLPTC